MLDTPDGLDLGGLTMGAPVPPVLVVSTVSLTLHDVLLAPVARVLVAHKAIGQKDGSDVEGAESLRKPFTVKLGCTYAPHCTCMEPTSGIIQPMPCREG